MEEIFYKGIMLDSMRDLSRMKGVNYDVLRREIKKKQRSGMERSEAIEAAVDGLVKREVEKAIEEVEKAIEHVYIHNRKQ